MKPYLRDTNQISSNVRRTKTLMMFIEKYKKFIFRKRNSRTTDISSLLLSLLPSFHSLSLSLFLSLPLRFSFFQRRIWTDNYDLIDAIILIRYR